MKCKRCKTREKKKHWNALWCDQCAEELKHKPKHTLTPAQQEHARSLVFKMPREQIAKEVGVSASNLKRWARDEGVRLAYFNKWHANPDLVKQICEFYAEHGMKETLEQFPGVRVRSVIERYPHEYRQIRWTEDQVKKLAQFAGLISHEAQAKYFARPGANEGSIKSAWMKKFKQNGSQINGLSWHTARHLVGPRCKPVRTLYWAQRPGSKRGQFSRKIVLWVDLEQHLLPSQPAWLRDAIRAMAKFQRWLHGIDHVRPKVKRLIQEMEG